MIVNRLENAVRTPGLGSPALLTTLILIGSADLDRTTRGGHMELRCPS
jgi:hypothetical protein